jgi:predicted phage tail protein
MYRAASVAIIFVASYYFHDFMSSRNSNDREFFAREDLKNPILQELFEADRYYATQVDLKKQELFELTTDSPDLQMDINNELEDLDAILLQLKQDLKDNADNEEVIEAMMMNYRLKLEILEDMLGQIRNQKNKNNNNEKGYSI